MARIRSLKIGFFKDEALASLSIAQPTHLSFAYYILFEGLWVLADREGRLEDRPRWIRSELFPYHENVTAETVDAMLNELAGGSEPFIVRYEVAGRRYIWVRKFLKHQKPHYNEPSSVYPAPPQEVTDLASGSGLTPDLLVKDSRAARLDLGSLDLDLGSLDPDPRSGNGSGDSSALAKIASALPPAKVLLTFPTTGKDGNVWHLTDQQVAEWSACYEGLNVLAEARKALAWVKAKPGRRKTVRGMPAFFVNWLNRATDGRGSGGGSSQPTGKGHQTVDAVQAALVRRHGGRS